MSNEQNQNIQQGRIADEEESIDIKRILRRYLSKWPWMLLSVILVMGAVWFYLRSTPPQYESTASVLVTDDEKGGFGDEMNVFSDLGINSNKSNLYNEIEVLKSRSLMQAVVKDLGLNKTLIRERTILKPDICYYEDAPLEFTAVNGRESIYEKSGKFLITPLKDNKFKLTEEYTKENDEIEKDLETHTFGEPVKTFAGTLVFTKTGHWNNEDEGKKFTYILTSVGAGVNALRSNMSVETVNKDASVLQIKITGTNKSRNNDILNNLIRQHERQAITEKNQITKNTSEFIAERMDVIEKELSEVEGRSEDFKTANKLVDVTSDAQMYMTKDSEIDQALLETNIQIKLAEYMLDFMQTIDSYNQLLPANLGIENEGLSEMLHEYNQLVLEHNKLMQNSSKRNPAVSKLQAQIASLQGSIRQSLENTRQSLALKLQSLEEKNQLYESKIADVPEYERTYRSIMRQQKIKETLYIYLLEKREENEIAMASTIGTIKIIDPAHSSRNPVSPKKKIFYLGAFLIGLMFPVGVIYIRDVLDNKVHSTEELEALSMPVAGSIPESRRKSRIQGDQFIIAAQKNTPTKNAFQMLRSNIAFLLPEKTDESKGQVLFVTSTLPGEGKTFLSLSLGNEFTINKQKVLIIGLDLRAPKIAEYLNMPKSKGISDYVIDKNLSIDDITIRSNDNENLSYIISGNIPPNPAEILMNKRLKELFEKVRLAYDYIIVDNPPIAMVVDTLSVIDQSDLMLYVVRAGYLEKKALELPEKLVKDKKIKNMATVLNGTRNQYSAYGLYGYGYAYGYGYGYGYGGKRKNRILRWLKKQTS
ncbi:MAG: GumC family protein [Bacteroidota bacterium]